MFEEVSSRAGFPELESQVLRFWREKAGLASFSTKARPPRITSQESITFWPAR